MTLSCRCRLAVVSMALSRPLYPERMSSRSPSNFRRIPSSVESCLQWTDSPADTVVRTKVTTTTMTTTKSVEQCDDRQQQQLQRREEASPARHNYDRYDGRRSPYDTRQKAIRQCTFSSLLSRLSDSWRGCFSYLYVYTYTFVAMF